MPTCRHRVIFLKQSWLVGILWRIKKASLVVAGRLEKKRLKMIRIVLLVEHVYHKMDRTQNQVKEWQSPLFSPSFQAYN